MHIVSRGKSATFCLCLILALGFTCCTVTTAQEKPAQSSKAAQVGKKQNKGIPKKALNQKEQTLEIKPKAEAQAAAAEQPYIVYLRNLVSGFCTFDGRIRSGGNWGPRFAVPSICQNCFTNCDDCFKKKQYSPILRVANCTEPPFDFEVRLRNSAGEVGGVIFNITPSCDFPGQVECVVPAASEKSGLNTSGACREVRTASVPEVQVPERFPTEASRR